MLLHSLNRLFIILNLALLTSCNTEGKIGLEDIELEWTDGEIRSVLNSEDSSLKVFVFMSPECPLCINYTRPIIELTNRFDSSGVKFYIVYAGDYYSSEEISGFESMYDFHLPAMYDRKNAVSKALQATVTPQAFLLNADGEVVYSGAIDNWAFEPGKKRQKITKHYLENAIISMLEGVKPEPSKTEAIGCFIEY